ncbi:SseB family protein [Streptomyces sp. NPDC057638]|uniref:SseB family protein n=1 Tax=Streptomyces sp. NPDC057638 TaxID=3346190 RepID=UPI0036B8771E
MGNDGGGTADHERPVRLADLTGGNGSAADSAPPGTPAGSGLSDDRLAAARGRFAALLTEFRRTPVLVPIDPYGSLWTAQHGGIRWICAFSGEVALARFAYAQGDAEREWAYETFLGARLLDVIAPAFGGPTGVALDAGSEGGMLFPPLAGIVPDAAAADGGEPE